VILAKDVQPHCVAYADFIFSSDGQFYVVTGDEDGVVRLYEYDPSGTLRDGCRF
jgi:cleavage and polyadenylation specificity factor subunit 1